MSDHLIPISELALKDSLNIYKNNHCFNLLDALAQTYPLCLNLVGETFFKVMSRHFIQGHPSESFQLEYYGEKFASFISNFSHAESVPYLSDVARLEWAIHLACIGKDPKTLDLSELQHTEQSKHALLVWMLLENSALCQLRYGVDELWHWHQSGQDAENFELEYEDIFLFVGRGKQGLILERLSLHEFEALQWLHQQRPLQDICESLLTKESSINMIEMLPNFIQRGFIDNFDFKQT